MQKVYKMDDMTAINCGPEFKITGINTIAYLGRLELYIPEQQWREASLFTQTALTEFINQLED